MNAAPEIVLAVNQSADAGTCGSCWWFQRRDATSQWDMNGECTFRLPPTRQLVRTVWDGETQPLATVQDTDGCDFWKSSGRTYIVSQRLKP